MVTKKPFAKKSKKPNQKGAFCWPTQNPKKQRKKEKKKKEVNC
jgi:hypothetical protein